MTYKLIATTAVAAMLTSTAFASSTSTDMSAPSMSVFTKNAPITQKADGNGYFEAEKSQILASTLLGKNVYNGVGEEAEAIGDVNDVIMAPNGEALAVIIGVGGFLGIGEKDVALDFSRISWTDKDGDKWLTVSATKQELENAPSYDLDMMSSASIMKPKSAADQ